MKKYMTAVIIALWGLALFQAYRGFGGQGMEADIVEAFMEVPLSDPSGEIEASGRYLGNYLDMSGRERLLIEIANQFGIGKDYEIQSAYSEGRAVTVLEKEASSASARLQFVTIEEANQNNVISTIQYLSIQLQIQEDLTTTVHYRDLTDQLMQEYTDASVSASLYLKGTYDGELTLSQRDQLSDTLLETLGANVITEHRDMELYTIYGYTTAIAQYQEVSNEKININIAMNYDEINENTEVYVASPLVNTPY